MNIAYNYFFNQADSSSWRQVELQGAQDSLQIFCNNFSLSAGTDFAIGLEEGTTLMDQGTTDMPAGNDWNTLGDCPSMSNDESHIYSDFDNDAFLYFSFSDKEPDCVSINVNTDNTTTPQPPGFCDIVLLCPPPSIPCGIVLLDSVILVIDTLERNPPWGMSQSEIDRVLGFAQHTKNIIVQDILIDLLEQDSIELALEWLDSVAVRMGDFDSLHFHFFERYDNIPQRPTLSNLEPEVLSIRLGQAIFSKENQIPEILPLSKTNISDKTISIQSPVNSIESFKIWPNPTDNELFISRKKDENPNLWNIIISDIHGKTKIKSSLNTEVKASINVSNLRSGIYFLSIISENTLIGFEKFIIAR